MSTDESGAPWPYEDIEVHDDEGEPTWECPGGQCDCHAQEKKDEEKVEHRIVFFDHVATRMPGARCRVLENGHLINKDSPNADGGGGVSVKIAPTTRYLRVEWAPEECPKGPRYPFRKVYHIDLGATCDDGVARRLHNIGYSVCSDLDDNVRDFQRTYLQKPTGKPADVETQLIAFHDASALPPVPPASARKGFKDTQDKSSLVGDGDSAKAKKGPSDKPVAPDPSPGAKPGKAKQGSVSGVQTTKVRIELHIAFALRPEDFATEDVEWKDVPYKIKDLLDEIYPEGPKRNFRFGGKGGFPVAGATLTREEMDSSEAMVTEKDGHVIFDLGDLQGKKTDFIFRVEPAPGQLNTTDKPAGPGLTDEKTDAKYLFRRFALRFEVDADGALLPDSVKTIHPPGNPRHAKIISVHTGTKKGENVILVDWRPDWIMSGKETSRRRRDTDRVNVPKNPFDLSIPEKERLEACPPALIIHNTGTANLTFLPGFIGDKNPEKTSIHYVVDYDGFVIKVLDEFYKANHGGLSMWDQRRGLNGFSVGIETMHSDTTPVSPGPGEKFKMSPRRYTKEQYDSFIRLLAEIEKEYPIKNRRLRGHMEILMSRVDDLDQDKKPIKEADGTTKKKDIGTLSRNRVDCPGPYFEWQRLEEKHLSLAPVAVPAEAPDASLKKDFEDLKKLDSVTTLKANSSSPEVKIVKQLLYDIGYSVSEKIPEIANRDTDVPRHRAGLSDQFDDSLQAAVRAFQTHHFSGRRRAYNILGTKEEKSLPAAGATLDAATIKAIQETWFAAKTSKT